MIDAALALLADGGYAGMTLGRIAADAGVSEALTIHHFGSKAELFRAVIDDLHDRFHEEEAAKDGAGARRGRDRIVDWVNARFDEFVNEPLRARAFLVIAIESATAVPDISGVIRDHNQLAIDFIVQAARDGIADGSIGGDIAADSATIAVIALVRGVGYEWFSDPAIDLESRRADVLSAVDRVLGPPVSGPVTNGRRRRSS
jgi:AcrR family transcriptional regulator